MLIVFKLTVAIHATVSPQIARDRLTISHEKYSEHADYDQNKRSARQMYTIAEVLKGRSEHGRSG